MSRVATNKARDDAKIERKEGSMFEADHVPKVGRRRDEDDALTKQLHRQVVCTVIGSKELAAVHAELESHKMKTDYLR